MPSFSDQSHAFAFGLDAAFRGFSRRSLHLVFKPCIRAPGISRLLLFVLPLMVFGCASPDVNPPTPRANQGYVDLHLASKERTAWDVQRFDDAANRFRSVLFQSTPSRDPILRLAFRPGTQRLRVMLLDRCLTAPVELEVQVVEAKITPVCITLTAAGTGQVQTKTTSVGGTIYGRYGRRTRINSHESIMYRVSAEAEPSVPYQVKEQMPYAH